MLVLLFPQDLINRTLDEKMIRDFFQYRSRYPSLIRGREWIRISFGFDEATAIISATRILDDYQNSGKVRISIIDEFRSIESDFHLGMNMTTKSSLFSLLHCLRGSLIVESY